MADAEGGERGLRRELRPLHLWGLGVGYVISGMYFGWNLGLPVGGPFGLLAATAGVTVLYVTFVLAYAELAAAFPRAGGAFAYAEQAFGRRVALLAGLAQLVEFVFAPPAIAAAIGAYVHLAVPGLSPVLVAGAAYLLFTAVNVYGVKASARLELVVTVLAVLELLVFAALTLPRFEWRAFAADPLPHGWTGALAAIPFAIWFYLGIEGLANVAEEAEDPQRSLPLGFGSSMATLVVLALLAFAGAVGVAGWRTVVYPPGADAPSDSPLPLALRVVVGEGHPMYQLLVTVGLLGLVASFHGLVLAAGRATFELGRAGYLPAAMGRVLAARGTPALALLANMVVGLLALATGRTSEIIVVAVFGALTLYAVSMAAFFALRVRARHVARPFRVPAGPAVAGVALALSVFALLALGYHQPRLLGVFAGIMAIGALGSALVARRSVAGAAEAALP